MDDYFEIDFLDVEAKKSGDAICIRYRRNGSTFIHVVDGGYQQSGEMVVKPRKRPRLLRRLSPMQRAMSPRQSRRC